MKQNEAVKQNFSENFLNTFIDTAFGWLFSFFSTQLYETATITEILRQWNDCQ